MKERATVVKIGGKIAVVQILKSPQCDSCKACAFRNGKSTVRMKAKNELGAEAGDEGIVSCAKDHRLLASFLAYILPVLFAGLGVLVGFFAFENEAYIALLSVGMLALGFGAVVVFDRALSKTKGFGMEITEIINTENEEEQNNG